MPTGCRTEPGRSEAKSISIDWTIRESARAKIRVMVRRILRKHGYPPDLAPNLAAYVAASSVHSLM